jgi:hypothetical protein
MSWYHQDKVVQHRCDRCVVKFAYDDAGRWRAPVACDGCRRAMVFDTSRAIPTILACGPDCRRIVRAAKAREARTRERGQERSCRWCFRPFPPTRADARFCSPGCRQKHHRWRHTRKAA